jgi:hypothetical protein
MMTAPPSIWIRIRPMKVISGIAMLRSTCLKKTVRSGTPFAMAVRT